MLAVDFNRLTDKCLVCKKFIVVVKIKLKFLPVASERERWWVFLIEFGDVGGHNGCC